MSELRDTLARITALEQPRTTAQQRYQEASERMYSNREVEMAAGAFDRAEEVAQELDDWTHLIHMRLNTMSERLAAIESQRDRAEADASDLEYIRTSVMPYGESPAAAEPVCATCNGRKVITNLTQYGDIYDEERGPDCNPAQPAAPEPIDPVKCSSCKGTRMFVLWRYEDNVFGVVCPFCKPVAR